MAPMATAMSVAGQIGSPISVATMYATETRTGEPTNVAPCRRWNGGMPEATSMSQRDAVPPITPTTMAPGMGIDSDKALLAPTAAYQEIASTPAKTRTDLLRPSSARPWSSTATAAADVA